VRHSAPVRRLALLLTRCAQQLLPARRKEWARAMHAELEHIEKDRDALWWAMGCFVTGIQERVYGMLTGNLKISRWILAPEMLLCFVPLTFGWLDGVGGHFGIIRLTREVIDKYVLGVPGGRVLLMQMLAIAILGVIGPLGLASAYRLIVLNRPLRTRWLRTALCLGPILFGLVALAARWANDGTQGFSVRSVDAFDFWSGVLLLSVLPALGAVHLLRAGSHAQERLAA